MILLRIVCHIFHASDILLIPALLCLFIVIRLDISDLYMRHSKEGDVKIYSETELVSMLSAYFHNVSWEQVGNTACIAMGEK